MYVCESTSLSPLLSFLSPLFPSPALLSPVLSSCPPSGQLIELGRRETKCNIWWWCDEGLNRETGDRISWSEFKKESTWVNVGKNGRKIGGLHWKSQENHTELPNLKNQKAIDNVVVSLCLVSSSLWRSIFPFCFPTIFVYLLQLSVVARTGYTLISTLSSPEHIVGLHFPFSFVLKLRPCDWIQLMDYGGNDVCHFKAEP